MDKNTYNFFCFFALQFLLFFDLGIFSCESGIFMNFLSLLFFDLEKALFSAQRLCYCLFFQKNMHSLYISTRFCIFNFLSKINTNDKISSIVWGQSNTLCETKTKNCKKERIKKEQAVKSFELFQYNVNTSATLSKNPVYIFEKK